MISTIDAHAFTHALSKVMKIPRNAFFSEIKVEFQDGACTLTATNFEQWAQVELPASGDSVQFVLPKPKELFKMCREFSGELVFELEPFEESAYLQLRCGGSLGSLMILSAGNFPALPELAPLHSYTLDSAHILQRVKRVG